MIEITPQTNTSAMMGQGSGEACVPEQQTTLQNESQTPDHSVRSPAESTCSKRSLVSDVQCQERKKRLSFKEHQKAMVNSDLIRQQLADFKKCCSRACYQWFNVRMVLYCREMFILQPNLEERRKWLDAEHRRLKSNTNWFCYSVDLQGLQRKECCMTAWLFAYGIPRATHQRHTPAGKEHRTKGKAAINREIGGSSAAVYFSVWLLQFAAKVGDKLPFGDSAVLRTEIRLPYPTKHMVYQTYLTFLKAQCSTGQRPLSYSRFAHIWKHNEQLSHIKLAKYKEGFSKCDVCSSYSNDICAPMTAAQREALDGNFFCHIAETRKERTQYYSTKCKGANYPDNCLSLIMDAMDQRKTSIPFFLNPPKSVSNCFVLRTKLMAVKVHGKANYLYWSTNQIVHDTNFSVECLRRSLLKLESEFGKLPPTLYIQCDNGPDMKSKQFIAFCASLVENKVFQKVKLGYLVVGHTHEDIDQYFSVISKYIKRTVKTVLSPKELASALLSAFTTPGCIPRCVEEIRYCYDTSTLVDSLDPYLARFNLHESTGDKVHYFLIRKNVNEKATLQYKLRRYSDALYPRKYQLGDEFFTEENEVGQVISSSPHRDPFSKQKFWNYTVRFKSEHDIAAHRDFLLPADDWTILVFPETNTPPIPQEFELAAYGGSVSETLGEQKLGVLSILSKLEFSEKKPKICDDWKEFWDSRVDTVAEVLDVQCFKLPSAQSSFVAVAKKVPIVEVDSGFRTVDVVNYSAFKNTKRSKVMKKIASDIPTDDLDELQQGMFVVVQLVPDPQSSPWYSHKFVIAEIHKSVRHLNTTNPESEFAVQVYLPCDRCSLNKKFMRWQGDDGKFWTPIINRGMVKGIVELTAKGKKLTKPSLDLITSFHF
jgi:hypothetical protein